MDPIFVSDINLLLRLMFFNFIIWITFLPIISILLPKAKIEASIMSPIAGWLTISFITFFISSIFGVPIVPTFFASIIIILEASLYLIYIKRFDIKNYLNRSLIHNLVFKNILMFALILAMYAFISKDAYINGIERVMDYGFLKAINNTITLPPEDIWYSGKPINYYYFGHFLAYTILYLSGIAIDPGFYISNLWLYGVTSILVFETAYNLVNFSGINRKKIFSPAAALISMFTFAFAGPWFSLYWFGDKVVNYFNKIGEEPFFWYAEPTRIIKGTITEFPIYSYLEATIHAHTFGYLIGAIVLYLLAQLWFTEDKNKYKFTYPISFMIGIAYITNTWDVLTLGAFSLLVFVIKFLKDTNRKFIYNNINELKRLIQVGIICIIIAILTVLPWMLYFEVPVKGMGRVLEPSDPREWFSMWGTFALFIGIYYVYRLIPWKLNQEDHKNKRLLSFIDITIFMSILYWVFMEIFYIKDILTDGEWFRANTIFKISAQIWLWLAIIIGPAFVYMLQKNFGKFTLLHKSLIFIVLSLIIFAGSIYPIETYKYFKGTRFHTGFTNVMDWYDSRYPDDYEAYKFLESLGDGKRYKNPPVLMEAAGESYKDNNLFSAFLGWTTPMGWIVHEWTWRGSYEEIISDRANDSWEFYTGTDPEISKSILDKYSVNYILISSGERSVYGENIQYQKIKDLGSTLYENEGTLIVEYKPHPNIDTKSIKDYREIQ